MKLTVDLKLDTKRSSIYLFNDPAHAAQRVQVCMCDSASCCYYAANSTVVQAKLIESQVQARVATKTYTICSTYTICLTL